MRDASHRCQSTGLTLTINGFGLNYRPHSTFDEADQSSVPSDVFILHHCLYKIPILLTLIAYGAKANQNSLQGLSENTSHHITPFQNSVSESCRDILKVLLTSNRSGLETSLKCLAWKWIMKQVKSTIHRGVLVGVLTSLS